jgi:hypothetical protein
MVISNQYPKMNDEDEIQISDDFLCVLYMCQLFLKLSSVLKLLILTAKILVRIKTRYLNEMF